MAVRGNARRDYTCTRCCLDANTSGDDRTARGAGLGNTQAGCVRGYASHSDTPQRSLKDRPSSMSRIAVIISNRTCGSSTELNLPLLFSFAGGGEEEEEKEEEVEEEGVLTTQHARGAGTQAIAGAR